MDNIYIKEVASTILAQLQLNQSEVWAWGSQNFMFLEREHNNINCPALIFSIRTPKVQRGGKVIISLNEGSDTYIVEAVRMYAGKEISLGKREDVYVSELHAVINALIEDEETYTQVQF